MLSLHRLGSIPVKARDAFSTVKVHDVKIVRQLTLRIAHLHLEHYLDGFRIEIGERVFFVRPDELLANISLSQEQLNVFVGELRHVVGDDHFGCILTELITVGEKLGEEREREREIRSLLSKLEADKQKVRNLM